MPRVKPEHKTKTKRYLKLKQGGDEQKETMDCGVISLAAVTGKTYKQCHTALAKQGRKPSKGTSIAKIREAAKALGFKFTELNIMAFISRYPKPHCNLKNISTHHPDRFPEIWDDGCTYLLQNDRHYAGLVNGVIHDWSKGRQLQMHTIYKVTSRKA